MAYCSQKAAVDLDFQWLQVKDKKQELQKNNSLIQVLAGDIFTIFIFSLRLDKI